MQPNPGAAGASYQSRSFTIAAGASAFVDTSCQLVAVLGLDGAADFEIRLNDGQRGLAFESWQFRAPTVDGIRKIELINTGAGAITVILATAVGEVVDGRFALPAALEVKAETNAIDTTADATVAASSTAQLLAANGDRSEALIQNLDGANSVRIGDANVGAARGLRLAPGDVLTLTTAGAIHCHNPNGAGVDIALAETTL